LKKWRRKYKFLDIYEPPKLNQEDINNLNRSIRNNEIESVIWSLPTKKNPGLDGFTAEIYQTFLEELTPMLLRLFHKIQKEGILSNSFYEVNTILLIKKKVREISLISKDEKNPQYSICL
jgi:hypothetical protein